MKWSDLTLKERKQIYDAVRAENPNASYFDIKSQFDLIPEYEDGKNRSRWLSDKAYRDSISTLQNSQRFKISKEFKSPTLEELRNDSSVGGNIGNNDGLFTVLDGLEALKTMPSITSEQIENATDSQYNSKINRLEPLKQYAKVGRLIEGTDEYTASSYAEPFTPTITNMPGTANHELGHIADGIAGSIKYEAEPGVDYITNPYLRYLADPDNAYTTKELRDAGFHSAAKNKRYLLNPTESKSHMLTLKRALKDSNKISKWSDPVDENMILDYFRSGRANGAVRNQYDLYIDKQRYIDRLNRLVPMEWLLPTIGLGGAEFLREKQNNKSN